MWALHLHLPTNVGVTFTSTIFIPMAMEVHSALKHDIDHFNESEPIFSTINN